VVSLAGKEIGFLYFPVMYDDCRNSLATQQVVRAKAAGNGIWIGHMMGLQEYIIRCLPEQVGKSVQLGGCFHANSVALPNFRRKWLATCRQLCPRWPSHWINRRWLIAKWHFHEFFMWWQLEMQYPDAQSIINCQPGLL
jgi:hypothetical protein